MTESMWNIFGSPWLLISVAAVLLVISAVLRAVRPDKFKIYVFLIPLLAAGLGFAVDAAYKTDHELIRSSVKQITRAVVKGDIETIDRCVSPNYTDFVNRNKQELMTYARIVLEERIIEKIRKRYRKVTPPEAEYEFVVHFAQQGVRRQAPPIVFVKVKLEFEKSAGKWPVMRSDIIEVNNKKVNWSDIKNSPRSIFD